MGIKHIQNIKPTEFINILENLNKYTITEKIDGVCVVAGCDSSGFFVSHKGTHAVRYYSTDAMGPHSKYDPLYGAFNALSANKAHLTACLGDGFIIECEVLHGRQPNAIVYGSSKIIILSVVEGRIGSSPSDVINRINGAAVSVDTRVTTSSNGINIEQHAHEMDWYVVGVPQVHDFSIDDPRIDGAMVEYKEWLETTHTELNMSFGEIIEINLTSIPKSKRPEVSQIRDACRTTANNFQDLIKAHLLDINVHSRISTLNDAHTEDDDPVGIEGMVIARDCGLVVKLVDVDKFTKTNMFNHAIRNELSDSNTNREKHSSATLRMFDSSLIHQLMLRLAVQMNQPALETNRGVRGFVRTFDNCDDAVNELAKNACSDNGKDVMQTIIDSESTLRLALRKFNQDHPSYKGDYGLRYNKTITDRTYLHFANTLAQLRDWRDIINDDPSNCGIITTFYGDVIATTINRCK